MLRKFRLNIYLSVRNNLIAPILLLSTSAMAQTTIPVLPSTLYNYSSPALPQHFQNRDIINADTTPANNPITNAGATLGRVLFYDKSLSVNDQVSCSSCHEQENGFSDSNRLSVGFEGGLTGRHSMGLANARYYAPDRFFWDERANNLEEQVLMPIQDSVEMGMTLTALVTKLSDIPYYAGLFTSAFGDSTINTDRISNALAQFVRSMVSYRSKYDEGVAKNFANFTEQELLGRQLFNNNQTNCSSCHETDLQISDQARNTGLDATTIDPGAGNATFKSPSLRNVAVRPPYMHDGRFNSLSEVISFYNAGIQDHPNLDNRLQRNGQPRRMNLDNSEQAALVAFLETLTDFEMLTDPAFSDPFKTINLISIINFLLQSED